MNLTGIENSRLRQKILIIYLFAINFIYFISSTYPVMTSNDGSHFALVSALVEDGSVKINKYIEYTYFVDYNLKDGDYYSDRPPGTAFLSIPFYAFGKLLRETGLDQYLSYRINISKVFVIFLPNIAGTIAILLLFKLYTFFRFNFGVALFSSFLFAFATLCWFESTRLFSHAVSMATVLSAVFIVITMKQFNRENIKRQAAATTIRQGKPNWTDSEGSPPAGLRPGKVEIKWSYRSSKLTEKTCSKNKFLQCNSIKSIIAVSALLALASIIEIQNILFVIPFVFYILLSKKANIKDIFIPLASAILIFVAVYSILLVYNFAAFDELTIKSNKYNPAFPEERSFITSLSGNFLIGLDALFTNFSNKEVIFDWSKGIKNHTPGLLIVSPIFILSLAGFYYFFKSHKNEALFFSILILTEVIIVACHKTVLTRHVFTILPLLFFPVIFIIRNSFEQINNTKNFMFHRYSLFSLIMILSSLSVARVFYIMNSYWTRSFSSSFRFIQEIPSYIVFYGLLLVLYYLFKILIAGRYATKNK